MSLHAGQAKKLLRGQLIIANVTVERAQGVQHCSVWPRLTVGGLETSRPQEDTAFKGETSKL